MSGSALRARLWDDVAGAGLSEASMLTVRRFVACTMASAGVKMLAFTALPKHEQDRALLLAAKLATEAVTAMANAAVRP